MPDPRIIDIELDERSILKRNADIEQERKIAIFDLIEHNSFAVAGHDGPYRVRLRVEEGRLASELLRECLAGKVEVDFDTARRLFTLICVLHIKQMTTTIDSPLTGHASSVG